MPQQNTTDMCWCGCGESTKNGRFFVSNHDRIAEAAIIRVEYGTTHEFLARHGYGPQGKTARQALSVLRNRN